MPHLSYELAVCQQRGLRYVAGVDEAGRGALAGPVVAAAVILPLDQPDLLVRLGGVRDSKQLTPSQREQLYPLIVQCALAHGIGSRTAAEIDQLGIVRANQQAMGAAVSQLRPAAETLLIDGPHPLPACPLPQQAIVKGDSLSLSIAAASILAKVTRDRLMVALAAEYPQYGFERHKGYGTAAHRAALTQYGPCPFHRRSFAGC
ncbi:MAG: ribonuclease HII [Chloroflexota bacterium]